jgi:uncharacterized protein (DUF433 family)
VKDGAIIHRKADAGLYIAGSRVSLDSIVYAFQQGSSPEEIQQDWPILSLEQVYGAITYYLANRAQVDEYIRDAEKRFANAVPAMKKAAPELYAKLRRAQQESAQRH